MSVTRDKRQVWRESVSVGILVVDDDPAAASSVSQVLQQQGYRTLLASDTDDARRRLRHETWHGLHLLMYLAVALSFAHTLAGPDLAGRPALQIAWALAYTYVFAVVLRTASSLLCSRPSATGSGSPASGWRRLESCPSWSPGST